ncbi:tyrosine-type recombinase/integrase [Kibdelosporangium philippinense]|uniref:Tyrosine-type recombinase/integrase n=2 Tax=Kibdelosporangium philippinense TaxID=211113 RepID=A0ABS8ZF55_9PSEU|nr:site-specific integrase [Kibdelosporangium philippinense]MCE7006410.1 tyrosine-type recombinase/integrase [Kibdelosporangium philippinense]
MGPFVSGFRTSLSEQGYSVLAVGNMLTDMGALGRWMQEHDVQPGQLSSAVIADFGSDCLAAGRRKVPSVKSFAPLLRFLRGEEVIGDPPASESALERLLVDYRGWLAAERGLAEMTIIRYENLARWFLQQLTDDAIELGALSGAQVVTFLLRESERVSVGSAKGRVAELRSLLKFLYVRGLTPHLLTTAVPPVAGWRDTSIPKALPAGHVQRLLDSCDRCGPVQVRDYAILMLVARLGLRSIEVARLKLGDIDWRGGRIILRGKASREDGMPLPADVGQALADYLADVRPATSVRSVFLSCKAPRRGIRPDLVSDVTRRACDRAGLRRVGAHRLRHSLATEMLRRGVKLVDIGQVLRHRDLATTALYAKVDLATLRSIALPWPGERR